MAARPLMRARSVRGRYNLSDKTLSTSISAMRPPLAHCEPTTPPSRLLLASGRRIVIRSRGAVTAPVPAVRRAGARQIRGGQRRRAAQQRPPSLHREIHGLHQGPDQLRVTSRGKGPHELQLVHKLSLKSATRTQLDRLKRRLPRRPRTATSIRSCSGSTRLLSLRRSC